MIFVFVMAELKSFDGSFDDETISSENELLLSLISTPLEIGFQILTIYFVYTWSKRWNEQYSKPS